MTLKDRYENDLTTTSQAARDAYVDAVDLILSARPDADAAFERAVAEDAEFALAHAGLARAKQISGEGAAARAAVIEAENRTGNLSPREQSHIAFTTQLISGNALAAEQTAREHLANYPRDALVVQPMSSVFGLIGFSGLAGREAEQLSFLTTLAPHYPDDWWFTAQLAFAQGEVGQIDAAFANIGRALAGNPRNANAAHINAHIHYEAGDTPGGLSFLRDWWPDYDRRGPLHCHLSWHVALWELEAGNEQRAWEVIDTSVKPGAAWGPALNILTDYASFLHRYEMAGGAHQPDRWKEASGFAAKVFAKPGIAFADAHAALAHAMVGNKEPLERIKQDAAGPAADLVSALAEAFDAFAQEDWADAIAALAPHMATQERIGGSRAQRDLLEYTFAAALQRLDRAEEARRFLVTRRPQKAGTDPVAGL